MPATVTHIGVCPICLATSRLVPHPTVPDEHWCQACTDEPFVNNDDDLEPLPPVFEHALDLLAAAHAARSGQRTSHSG